MKTSRRQQVQRRHRRLRRDLNGTPDRPRLSIFRSNNHIYAQVIDDVAQQTLVCASSLEAEFKAQLSTGATIEASSLVGKLVATRAKTKGIEKVVFDRGGNLYHGRVKALAEAAREEGLDF
ncbi:MAG: 50S ribosomal protein L18 [Cyanobacteriota bacterium ELA615]|jgi:large subunit ribosomal protein L18